MLGRIVAQLPLSVSDASGASWVQTYFVGRRGLCWGKKAVEKMDAWKIHNLNCWTKTAGSFFSFLPSHFHLEFKKPQFDIGFRTKFVKKHANMHGIPTDKTQRMVWLSREVSLSDTSVDQQTACLYSYKNVLLNCKWFWHGYLIDFLSLVVTHHYKCWIAK